MFSNTDTFSALDSLLDNLATGSRYSAGTAPLDIYRRGENVWIHVDLPGVAADSIEIDVERSVLSVAAERSFVPAEGDQMYRSERRQGRIRRQIHLGEGLDTEAIEADYHDGVLTLRVPVAEKAKPRRITVNTSAALGDSMEVAEVESASS